MPFAQLQDARLYYTLEGLANAPVVALSCSLGTSLYMWDSQVLALTKTMRVLRYDMRGHGQSSIPPGPYSIERLGRDVLGLLDQLDIERVHFCGLSIGGQIGMWLAVNAPDRVNKLVLCNTAAKIGTAETWDARIEAVKKGGMKAIAAAVIERWFSAGFRAKDSAAVSRTQQLLETTKPAGYVACCAAVRDFDYREKVSAIRAPTLVISGTSDVATTPIDGHFLADTIPGALYKELAAAHLSNIEDRDRFTAELCAFLKA